MNTKVVRFPGLSMRPNHLKVARPLHLKSSENPAKSTCRFDTPSGHPITWPPALRLQHRALSLERAMPDLVEKAGGETLQKWITQFEQGYEVSHFHGQTVCIVSYKGRGVAGSMRVLPTSEVHYEAYCRWRNWQIPEPYEEKRAEDLFIKLRDRLARRGVTLQIAGREEVARSVASPSSQPGKAISPWSLCYAGYAMDILDEVITFLPRNFYGGAGVRIINLLANGSISQGGEISHGGRFDPRTGSIFLNEFGLTRERTKTRFILLRNLVNAWGAWIENLYETWEKRQGRGTTFSGCTVEELKEALDRYLENKKEWYRLIAVDGHFQHFQKLELFGWFSLGEQFGYLMLYFMTEGPSLRESMEDPMLAWELRQPLQTLYAFMKNHIFDGRDYE